MTQRRLLQSLEEMEFPVAFLSRYPSALIGLITLTVVATPREFSLTAIREPALKPSRLMTRRLIVMFLV
jgi:hypothetical protein